MADEAQMSGQVGAQVTVEGGLKTLQRRRGEFRRVGDDATDIVGKGWGVEVTAQIGDPPFSAAGTPLVETGA